MRRTIYLSLLVAILSEVVMAFPESNEGSSNLLVRKRRIIDQTYQRRHVTHHDIPYIVSIRNRDFTQCGGSILSPNIILTAAHCVHNLVSTVNVMSNTIDRNNGQVHMVKHLQMYPNYTHMTHMEDDLALLYIEPPINFVKSSNRKIDFYNGPLHPGIISTISGWGCTNVAPGLNAYPNQLQATEVPLINTQECKQIFEKAITFAEKHLCTLHKEGKRGACRGDGGGPLVINGKLAGVLSGYPVNRAQLPLKDKPDLYVNLAYPPYRDWIVNTIAHLERIGPFAPWYGIPGFHETHHV